MRPRDIVIHRYTYGKGSPLLYIVGRIIKASSCAVGDASFRAQRQYSTLLTTGPLFCRLSCSFEGISSQRHR